MTSRANLVAKAVATIQQFRTSEAAATAAKASKVSAPKQSIGSKYFSMPWPKGTEKLTSRLLAEDKGKGEVTLSAADVELVEEMRAAIRAFYVSLMPDHCTVLSKEAVEAIEALLAYELNDAELSGHVTYVIEKDIPEGVVAAKNVITFNSDGIAVWQGDMSLLRCDAVVNPANGALLGCFLPPHRCLDNILHAQAGPRLRIACMELREKHNIQWDDNGQCRVTSAACLPAKHVLHTVGPNLNDHLPQGKRGKPRNPTDGDRRELQSCYTSCLETAASLGLQSIAFCCISTGVFAFPAEEAASLAVNTVLQWKHENDKANAMSVVFNVFRNEDLAIYQKIFAQLK